MRKIAILFMIPIIVFTVLGSSYGLWSKTVSSAGTVYTSQFSIYWKDVSSNDPPTSIDPGYDKDVADCNPKINPSPKQKNGKITLSIDNAYPSYRCRIDFKIGNDGNMPAIIDQIKLTYDSNALEITEPNIIGSQIHPGDSVDGSLEIHVIQPAQQNNIYDIFMEVRGVQWNEANP